VRKEQAVVQFESVLFSQCNRKGELGGPGDLVIQDRLVANTQWSSSLNLAGFPGTKVSAPFGPSLDVVKDVCCYYSQMMLKKAP